MTVFVKNLNFKTSEDTLEEFLTDNDIKDIKSVKIVYKDGRSCGFGFVEFNEIQNA